MKKIFVLAVAVSVMAFFLCQTTENAEAAYGETVGTAYYPDGETADASTPSPILEYYPIGYKNHRWDLTWNQNLTVTEQIFAVEHQEGGHHKDVNVHGYLSVSSSTETKQLTVSGNSDTQYFYNDGTDCFHKFSDGTLEISSDETNTVVQIGKNDPLGGGTATLRLQDDSGAYLTEFIQDDGTLNIQAKTSANKVVVNDDSDAANDFRVETGALEYALYIDGGLDRIGINDSSPDALLDVAGDVIVDDGLTVGENVSAATYGSDKSVSDAELLYLNTVTSNVQTQIDGVSAQFVDHGAYDYNAEPIHLGSDLTVTKDLTVNNNLLIAGKTTLTGDVTVSDDVTIDGNLYLADDRDIVMGSDSSLVFPEEINFEGSMVLTGDLSVSESVTLTGGNAIDFRNTENVGYITVGGTEIIDIHNNALDFNSIEDLTISANLTVTAAGTGNATFIEWWIGSKRYSVPATEIV